MNPATEIRPAEPGDHAAMLALNHAADPRVFQLTRAALEDLLGRATLAWVAVLDQRVLGYLVALDSGAEYDGEEFGWFRARGREFVYVDQVVVHADTRGTGVGTALYQRLEQWARGRGATALTCEVHLAPPNPESYAFHRRRGFLELDRLDTSDGRRVALLHKPLLPVL